MSTYTTYKARRLGKAIHPILVPIFLCKFLGQQKSYRAGIFRCQRRYVPIVLRNPSFLLSFVTLAEWNSGDRTQKLLWHSTSNSDVIFHSVTLQTPTTFMEVLDQAQWGTLYYAMIAVS